MDVKNLLNHKGVKTTFQLLKSNMLIILTAVVFLVFTAITGGLMIEPNQISLLIQQNSYIIILAIGMLICILTGGNIDLSVGSMVCLIGTIAGVLMIKSGVSFWLALPVCLVVGLALGAWQGFWIAYMRVPAFIVTLTGMLLFRGIGQLIDLGGMTGFPKILFTIFARYLPGGAITVWIIFPLVGAAYVGLKIFGRIRSARKGYKNESIVIMLVNCALVIAGIIFLAYSLTNVTIGSIGILAVLVILAIVILAYSYFTTRTVYGRQIYAIGGNEKAAKLSGINTKKMIFFAYVNMALLAVIATFIVLGRGGASNPKLGTGFEMEAIAACYIGGASAYGGRGKVGGVVVGAVFIGIINMGMNLMAAPEALTSIVKATVLLAGVAFDVISKRRGKAI